MVTPPINVGGLGGAGGINPTQPGLSDPASGTSGDGSFSDALKNSIDEVSRLQQDASKAVDDLSTGNNSNVTGVMTAVEKADLAFKTLLAIRSKLIDAYNEIKSISV